MMTLTIEALGLYGVPVINSDSPQALNMGVVHVPGTSFPWDEGAQRNVYIAGHRYGYLGTNSRLVFFNLNELRRGNEIILEDHGGRVYKYQVDEVFETGPNDYWVMDQVLGRDLLTLQTCTPIPTFEKRLIVRADRA
jgi:sortase A